MAFITDSAATKRLPYRDFPRSAIDAWVSQIEVIESMNFDIIALAHGNVGTKLDAADARVYMLQLRDQVPRGPRAGKTKDELAASVTMQA